MLEDTAVEAIIEEIHQVRHHGLRALALQQFHQVVVGHGHVFDQNFPHHAHTGLDQRFIDGQFVKGLHQLAANLPVGAGGVLLHQRIHTEVPPLCGQRICGALLLFIRADAVETAHEQIAVDQRADRRQQ